jgi:hypothetical protein
VHYLENKKINVCPSSKGGQTLTWSLADYFFLWIAQRFDFPDAKLLHGLPSFVLAIHFTPAICPPPF